MFNVAHDVHVINANLVQLSAAYIEDCELVAQW